MADDLPVPMSRSDIAAAWRRAADEIDGTLPSTSDYWRAGMQRLASSLRTAALAYEAEVADFGADGRGQHDGC